MKSLFLSISVFACTLLQAQTQGTLSFSFTQTAHTSYTGNKNVLAVWINQAQERLLKHACVMQVVEPQITFQHGR